MKKLALLSLSPIVLANMAFAGGMNTPAYQHEARPHHHAAPRLFNGFSIVGALGGMAGELQANHQQVSSVKNTVTGPEPGAASASSTGSDDLELFESSFAGYIGVDYAYQWHNGFVLGLGVTAGFDNINFNNTELSVLRSSSTLIISNNSIESTVAVELENDFAILFKPGFVVRRNTLIYALVGPRWGNIETSVNSFDGAEGASVFSDAWDIQFAGSDDASGYQLGITAGAGIKQMVSEHMSIGLEYAFTHYGDLDSVSIPYHHHESIRDVQVTSLDLSGSDSYDNLALTTHAVLATLSYRF